MVLSEVREAADAVVTVSEDLNPQLVVFLQDDPIAGQVIFLNGKEMKINKEQGKKRYISSVQHLPFHRAEEVLTDASLSKRANSSFSSFTSSWALQAEDSWVKPTMSANRILKQK